MVPEIPTDYTGVWYANLANDAVRWSPTFNKSIPSPTGTIPNDVFAGGQNLFAPLMPLWAANKPIPGGVSGCPGKCTAQIVAPALATASCTKQRQPLDYAGLWNFDHPFEQRRAPPLGHDSFIIDMTLDVSGKNEQLNTITAFVPSHDCAAYLEVEICSLVSAVGEYDITIENEDITVDSAAHPRIIGIANNTRVNRELAANGYYPSTLAGVVGASYLIWNSYVFTAKTNGSIDVMGQGAHKNLLFQRGVYNETTCPAFVDPREGYTANLNKLMVFINLIILGGDSVNAVVLLGVTAAQGIANPQLDTLDSDLPINATTTGHITGVRSVFSTNYWFFFGAALVELICIGLIVPTYWDWWQIGRPVSFSPLEIARAFEAPILRDINSNSTGVEIAKYCNDQRIQYGSTLAFPGRTKLAFSQPEVVSRPRRGGVIEI